MGEQRAIAVGGWFGTDPTELWESGRLSVTEAYGPHAGLESLSFRVDSNQQALAERILRDNMLTDMDSDYIAMVDSATATASALLPTARQAAREIVSLRLGPSYCYLAFHGLEGIAQFVKIGVSRHPEQRLYGMATGNPLDCLWVYVCRLPCAQTAFRIEQSLLRHLEANKRRGEWIHVGNTGADSAEAMARQLTRVAKDIVSEAGDFGLLGYTDGR